MARNAAPDPAPVVSPQQPVAVPTPRPMVFLSYCHEDKHWKERIAGHLRVLDQLEVWDDRQIPLGEDWNREIEKAIMRAQVAILVISDAFLNSEFIRTNEVPLLLKLQEEKRLKVIPVIARPCAWRAVEWLERLQCFEDGRALSKGDAAQIDEDLATLTEKIQDLATLAQTVRRLGSGGPGDVEVPVPRDADRQLLWNLGLLFLVVLGLACFPATHVSFLSGMVSAILGSTILGAFLAFGRRLPTAAEVLGSRWLTYLLGLSVLVLAILNYIFFPNAAIEIALGNRVFHKLNGQEYTLLVKREGKTIVEQDIDSRAAIYTGAPEVSLRALFYSSKDRLKDELQNYLKRSGGTPQDIEKILDNWLPNDLPKFVASRALRQGDHIVVEIPCPGRGKIMVAKEVELKEDQPPIFLEMERGNSCATTD